MVSDFLPNLQDYINHLDIPCECRLGAADEPDVLWLHPAPGSKTIKNYYNGIADKALNYRLLINSDNVTGSCDVLNKIMSETEMLEDLPSANGSYEFHKIEAIAPPYQMVNRDHGTLTYALTIQATLTIKNQEEE